MVLQHFIYFKIDQFTSYYFFGKVSGSQPTRPAVSFVHFGFDTHLMGVIRKSEYAKPTPIQAQVGILDVGFHGCNCIQPTKKKVYFFKKFEF